VTVLSGWGLDIGRAQHHDKDGSWHDMEDVTDDVAREDPERGWFRGRIFRCKVCDEEFRIEARETSPVEPLGG
jgi:hypothetical protein